MTAHRVQADLHKAGNRLIVKDPGNAGTLNVRRSPAYVPLVSAAAETRTLARPTAMNDLLTLQMKTDGGDITLTVTGGFNEDGDTTFTFSDAGQFAMFVSCYDGTNYFWRKFADYSDSQLTPTESAFLDGATAGTVVASKAVVVDANKDIGTFRHLTISGNFITGATTLSEAELGVLDAAVAGTPAVSKAVVLDAGGGVGVIRSTGGVRPVKQAAPTAKTTSTTIAAAELLAGIITGNQGGAAAATYTTDTGTAIETAFAALVPGGVLVNDDSFDFHVINISAVAAETVTIAAGATVTLVGDMTLAAVAVGDQSGGHFRCRRTAANNYTIYRIA